MIIRSVEPRAPAHLYWLVQVALLLILIAAMVIAGSALGSHHVIRSLLNIGRTGSLLGCGLNLTAVERLKRGCRQM